MTNAPQCFVSDVLRAVQRLAPAELAEAWDNVGLQVGHPATAVRRVLVALELTAPVLAEAQEAGAEVIVTHHPLIFKPWSALNLAQPGPALAAQALQAGLAVIAAHTNLDAAEWSTAHALAERMGWKIEQALAPRAGGDLYKFVVYVPEGHEQAVIDAIARGGGGQIGAYSHCTFRSAGTGTFRGTAGTNPFIGEPGKLEQAAEFRLETIVPAQARESVYREVRAAHPYEEMAYDWFLLAQQAGERGLGGIVKLEAATNPAALAAELKSKLAVAQVRLAGPPEKKIKRVAICTGSGGSFLGMAAAKADALVTGEINYHHGIEALQRGIAVLEVGHFESEVLVAAPWAQRLAADEKLTAAGVQVSAATRDVQPFRHA